MVVSRRPGTEQSTAGIRVRGLVVPRRRWRKSSGISYKPFQLCMASHTCAVKAILHSCKAIFNCHDRACERGWGGAPFPPMRGVVVRVRHPGVAWGRSGRSSGRRTQGGILHRNPSDTAIENVARSRETNAPVRLKLSTSPICSLHREQGTEFAGRNVRQRSMRKKNVRAYCWRARLPSRSLPTSPSNMRTSDASARLNSSRYCERSVGLHKRIDTTQRTPCTLKSTCSWALSRTASIVSGRWFAKSARQPEARDD